MRRIRPQRIAEQIKKELGVLLQQEVKDPRIGFVTVTGVEVTPDYEEAKVYVSIMGDEEEREQALEGLKRAQGFLRTELGRRIEVRHIPELIFKLDTSLDYGLRIDRLLSELKGASEEAGGHEGDRFSGVEDGDPSAGEGSGRWGGG
ncbi:MAG: 30S ribosome-binding factor RbfA [Hydrogenibacillus sp.]|nr:30S ribosome-binding factor RbfA [Hydrogenibacillus sp.]